MMLHRRSSRLLLLVLIALIVGSHSITLHASRLKGDGKKKVSTAKLTMEEDPMIELPELIYTESGLPSRGLKGGAKKKKDAKGKEKKSSKKAARKNWTIDELMKELAELTYTESGPFGEDWVFVKVYSEDEEQHTIRYPLMTASGSIIKGYVGQTVPPIQISVDKEEFRLRLLFALGMVKILSTAEGIQASKEKYEELSALISSEYEEKVGVPYPGTAWDYLDAMTNLDINLLPYYSYSLKVNVRRRVRTSNETRALLPGTDDCFLCPTPPNGCRVGFEQDVMECLKWEMGDVVKPANPERPEYCSELGFKSDFFDESCVDIADPCYGSASLYQEFVDYSSDWCCKCDAYGGAFDNVHCPNGWISGLDECLDLARNCDGIWSRLMSNSYSAYLEDGGDLTVCCKCQEWDNTRRNLGFWDCFVSIVSALFGETAPAPVALPAQTLITASDVIDQMGFQAQLGVMSVLKDESCYSRVEKFLARAFSDDRCTQPYRNAWYFACQLDSHCVQKNHFLCGESKSTPSSFYWKADNGSCVRVSWNQYFPGSDSSKTVWCGCD